MLACNTCLTFLQECIVDRWINEEGLSDLECAIAVAMRRVLAFDRNLHWTAFERWIRDYTALRLLLARRRGLQCVSLSKLFQGAWVGADIDHLEVALSADSVGSVRDISSLTGRRFPPNNSSSASIQLSLLQPGAVYLNAAGAPCDIVVAFDLVQYGDDQTAGPRVPVLFECRHTALRPADAVRVKITEIEQAVVRARDALGIELSERFALMFITNRQLVNSKSQIVEGASLVSDELSGSRGLSKAIVVVRQNCVTYFGVNLVRRFMGLTEPWELLETR